MDNTTEIVGFCAMCLSAMKNVPQFKKICDDDNVASFSKEAILLGIFATLLWIYYGVNKKSPSMFIGSIAALLYEFYILHKILKSENSKKE